MSGIMAITAHVSISRKVINKSKNHIDICLSSAMNEQRKTRGHGVLKATYLVETNAYETDVSAIQVKTSDLNIVFRAMNYFTDGMNSYLHRMQQA